MAVHCLSSCFAIPFKSKSFSGTSTSFLPTCTLRSLSFCRNLSENAMHQSVFSPRGIKMVPRRSVICEAAPTKKPDSAAKRARQAEKRRIINKARKSEIKTRMKKVFEALDALKKNKEAEAGEILAIEKLIGEAYSAIDKAVQKGTLHRNTGAHRKSRLSRRKKAVEIHHGWYTPQPAA